MVVADRGSYPAGAGSLPDWRIPPGALALAERLRAEVNRRLVIDSPWMAGLFVVAVSELPPRRWPAPSLGMVLRFFHQEVVAHLGSYQADADLPPSGRLLPSVSTQSELRYADMTSRFVFDALWMASLVVAVCCSGCRQSWSPERGLGGAAASSLRGGVKSGGVTEL